MKRFDWSKIDPKDVRDFAYGKISGTNFYGRYKGTKTGGSVRLMLRERGVSNFRELARCAANRQKV